jgi:hypothetical protein
MAQHNEVTFEDEICQALAAEGWIYEPHRKAGELYDATRALVPEDVFAWLGGHAAGAAGQGPEADGLTRRARGR